MSPAASSNLPVTLAVVCYGPHVELARRFLESLYRHTDPSHFVLRAGLNEVVPATRGLFERFAERHGNLRITAEERNTFKSPLMRRLLHEEPIPTPWVLWCDDDTHFTRSDWLQRLVVKMECAPEVAQWGQLYTLEEHDEEVLEWIRKADWFRGLPFDRPAEGGSGGVQFTFATGAFWALKTEVLYALDWPDPRLVQAREDIVLGEALRQNGFTLGECYRGVRVNDGLRRNAAAREIVELG